ncbi:hypothetical protein H0H93_015457 [Arthromyces matolae]|nr:hypothetical protein H0H93_015457 [Arthromyces matolae]
MTARAVCVLIWVHASGRIKIGLTGDSWKLPWTPETSSLRMLFGASFYDGPYCTSRWLLPRPTELVSQSSPTVVSLTTPPTISQGNRVWPSILIWGLDRALRWIRILICNAGYLQKSSREQQYGNLEVLSPHFIRVSVKRPAYIHWRPGQSMHLTIPGASSSMFEAHPFTISTIDTPRLVDVQDNENDIDGKDDGSSEEFESNLKTLTFIIRVRSGFTRRLLSRASDKAPGLQVFLDGPYGSPPSLRGFNTVVLIAGGSGVTFTLPLLLDVIRHAKEGTTDCTRLSFIWALRDNNINWIMDTLRPAMTNIPAGITVSINIYLTTSDGEESIEANDKSNIEHLISPGVVGLHIKHGRPDLQHHVETEVAQTIGAISFNGKERSDPKYNKQSIIPIVNS